MMSPCRDVCTSRWWFAAAIVAAAMMGGCGDTWAQRGSMPGGYGGPRPATGMGAGGIGPGGIGGGGFGGGGVGGGGLAVRGLGLGIVPGIAAGPIVNSPTGAVVTRGPRPPGSTGPRPDRAARRGRVPPADHRHYVPDEVIVELAGAPSDQRFDALSARYRLARLEAQRIGLTNSTWVRWRITDRRSVPAVIRALQIDRVVRWAQPNYLFDLEQAVTELPAVDAPAGGHAGDPAQYALAKLHLPQAHALARGRQVVVAVIDTEIETTNPELADAIVNSYDALGTAAPMEPHGTGIAGIIAAHARLLGAAPDVRILAIRAFAGGRGTTFAIIKGLDFAVTGGAKVVNMSFGGPADPALARAAAAAHAKGTVLIAAAGNNGPKSPPVYPAADPHVIAVTAIDADDRPFAAANRGDYVALTAPGVDILVTAPRGRYVISSGTSFAAAYVAGTAALLVERRPDLAPDAVKKLLTSTARDLGPQGRDDQFGAGLVDASEALQVLEGRPAADLTPSH